MPFSFGDRPAAPGPRARRLDMGSQTPKDAAGWARLGQTLIDGGDPGGGEAAYRTGIEAVPDDAQLQFRLGQLLQHQRRKDEAAEAYRRSFGLRPAKAAFDALAALRVAAPLPDPAAAAEGAEQPLLIELDDLLTYARHNRTLSGIQRVQVSIIEHLLTPAAGSAATDCAFVFGGSHGNSFWRVRLDDLRRFIDGVNAAVTLARLIELVDAVEGNATPIVPHPGQCYFVLGAFWAFDGDATRYVRLKEAGVATGALIYDLIPLSHPKFCEPELQSIFLLSVGDGFVAFDFILTISEFTAREVRRFREANGLRPVPVKAVRLAHLLQDKAPPPADWTGAIAPLKDRRFVLCVSTIEARKNHAYLVGVWQKLLAAGLDPPDLVFAGKYGWLISELRTLLEATSYLDGRIHVLQAPSDAELERLYQACLFTTFPSFVEGWGLPVGESLAHGRPCIASTAASIPEVGGDLVDYIDPDDIDAGVETFRRMAFDDEYRARRESELRRRFVARTWQDVGADLVAAIVELRPSEIDRRAGVARLDAGEVFVPSELRQKTTAPANYVVRPLRAILAEGWYLAEDFGVWMQGGEGALRCRTDLAPGTEIAAYLYLVAAPWAENQTVEVSVGAPAQAAAADPARIRSDIATGAAYPARVAATGRAPLRSNHRFLCQGLGRVGAGGVVELRLRLEGRTETPAAEIRQFWVGLIGFAYAAAADIALRTRIRESLGMIAESRPVPPARHAAPPSASKRPAPGLLHRLGALLSRV